MVSTATGLRRPTTVTAAVLLTVVGNLASIPFFFSPGADEIPTAGIVLSVVALVLTLVGAWGMWNLRRWGAILTFVLMLLNTLASLPGLIEPPSGWILAEIIALTPVSIAILILIAHPASRRAYR
jgi:hypothetical protein